MASLPGLHLRGSTYQLRTIIPLALRPHFGGRAKISQSLRTTDSREAKASGTAMRAALLANFEQLRRGNGSASTCTPTLAGLTLTRGAIAPSAPARAVEAEHPTPPVSTRPAQAAETGSSGASACIAAAAGPNGSTKATEGSPALGEQLFQAPRTSVWTLRAVHTKWRDFERRSADATRANELALLDFEAWVDNTTLPVGEITRQMGVEFKSWLVRKVEAGDCAGKTAHMRLVNVCALLRFAHQELEVIPRQPWRGLSIEYKTEAPRRPWSDAALQAFFSQPLFQAYALPKHAKAGADAAYWIPLLGLYTGATVSELAQLLVGDVDVNTRGEAFLHFTDSGDGQQLKTEQRARVVPVHSELVRLGFLDYVRGVKASGHDALWPKLSRRQGRPGGYFSQWFNEFRRGIKGVQVPDFHSLRHTVRSQMTEADFDAHVQDRITGHGVRGSAGVRVYTHPTLSLRRAIESITYAAISMPRSYAGMTYSSDQEATRSAITFPATCPVLGRS